jgi:hypothetical protein
VYAFANSGLVEKIIEGMSGRGKTVGHFDTQAA